MLKKLSAMWRRTWSLALVCAILVSVFGPLRSEAGRAIASVLCISLLVHCWYAQKKRVRRRQMVLISFALLMPTMAAIWLGLNVVRFYSYDGEAGNLIYLTVIGLQSAIEFSVVVVACLVVLWSAIELVGLLAKRASHT